MAGLLIAVGSKPGWAQQQVERHLSSMLHQPWLRARTFSDSLFAAALVLHQRVEPPLWQQSASGAFTAIFGEYYHDDRGNPPAGALADALAESARDERWDALRNRNGIYNLVVWEPDRRRLALANDATGALLLAATGDAAGRLWCSDPGVLPCRGPIDPIGLRSLLAIGYQADARTLREGVSVIPAATTEVVTVDDGGALALHRSSRMPDPAPHAPMEKQFQGTFRAAMELRLRGQDDIEIPLTGGEDSRLLACGANELGCRARTFTVDAAQPRDAVIASLVARRLGFEHRVVAPPSELPAPVLRATLAALSDWHSAIYLPVCGSATPGATTVLGFLGGTFAGAMVDRRSAATGLAQLRQNAAAPYRHMVALQQDIPWCEVPPGAGDAPPELLANLYGRQRRYTSYLVRLAWNFGQPICPFADSRLLALALSASRRELAGQSARRAAAARMHPHAASIPSANDGLPLNARTRRAVRGALRRLGLGKLARRALPSLVSGFDYGRLGPAAQRWLAEALATRIAALPAELPPMLMFALLPLLHGEPDDAIAAAEAMLA